MSEKYLPEKRPDDETSPAESVIGFEDYQISARKLGSFEPHVFTDPVRAEHWKEVYDGCKYEGRHRFDPSLTWSPETERRLKRKLDWRVMAWVWIMFSSLDLVRRNINRAVSDDFLTDIGVNTNDYNTGQTIYLVCFLSAELPGGLISKKVGPFRYTPAIIMLWGALCSAQAAINGRASFWAFRALLGFCQGGFIPEMVLYLSYFYKGNELPIRLSWFWTAIPLTQAYGALLAAGFLQMRGIQGWGGWQWLFLLEGLICIVVGAVSFFVMPPSISEPATAFKRTDGTNKWWTEEEEKILINRILRDDPTKGDMNNRQHVTIKGIWAALSNVDLWPVYLLGITAFIPFQPTANYLSLILRQMGYSVFESNMLAIPGYIIFAINIVFFGWLSEKLNERSLVGAWSNIWMLPFFIGLICIKRDANPWVRYTLLTGIAGIPYTHSILVGMTSRNAKSVGTRAVSACIYNMCYQIGSIIAVNIYREEDKPYYYTANKALTGLVAANICLFVGMKLFYIWRNNAKTCALERLSVEERKQAVDTRFAH